MRDESYRDEIARLCHYGFEMAEIHNRLREIGMNVTLEQTREILRGLFKQWESIPHMISKTTWDKRRKMRKANQYINPYRAIRIPDSLPVVERSCDKKLRILAEKGLYTVIGSKHYYRSNSSAEWRPARSVAEIYEWAYHCV